MVNKIDKLLFIYRIQAVYYKIIFQMKESTSFLNILFSLLFITYHWKKQNSSSCVWFLDFEFHINFGTAKTRSLKNFFSYKCVPTMKGIKEK